MNRNKSLILLVFISITTSLVFVNFLLKKSYLDQVILNKKNTVDIYRDTLEAALARFDYLPQVLSQNNKLFEQAFDAPSLANKSLLAFRESSKVDIIYIMEKSGDTIASSNWDQKNTLVGNNYSYRPYFKQSLKEKKGQYFGVGATTNVPGYFVSAPYRNNNEVKAVIVAKVLLSPIVDSWNTGKQDEEIVFVADESKVIILSSKKEWLYHSLEKLNPQQNRMIKEQRQFGNSSNPLLDIKKDTDNKQLVEIWGDKYIKFVASPEVMNWTIHHLTPYSTVSSKLFTFWSKILTLLLIGLAAVLTIRGLYNRAALRRSQGESSALRKLNLTLETEIEERKSIEKKLITTQAELRRSSKLAAMGQLSASITHEIGQPLAAMRLYIANLKMTHQQLIDESKSASKLSIATDSISTFGKLDQLVSRLTSITQQLRYFARSGDHETRPLDFRKAISGAINTTLPSIQEAGIRFDVRQSTESLIVQGGRVRLEQVIVNLLKNAMEAILELPNNLTREDKWIKLSLKRNEDSAILTIADSGPGVSREICKELFEPFFTTKASGIGMGLGLAISLNIVHELKGTLHVENIPNGGARFVITLPLLNDD
jgi:two-component system C4-dicarboxylate transport sensor histidine kinase DctB